MSEEKKQTDNYTIGLKKDAQQMLRDIRKRLEADDKDGRPWRNNAILYRALGYYYKFLFGEEK